MSAEVESAEEFAERLLRRYWQTGVDGTAQDIVGLIRKRDAAIRAQARAEALEEAAKRCEVLATAAYYARVDGRLHQAYSDAAAAIRQLAERTERDG